MNTTSPTLICYRASGRVSADAPLRLVFAAVPLSLLLGWLYALAIFHSPLMIVSLALWAIFSLSLSLLVCTVLAAGHSRSPAFNAWAGAAIAFVALWAHWIVMFKQYGPGQAPAVEFASSGPMTWIRLLGALAARLHEQNPRLDALPLIWAVEAALAIALTVFLAGTASSEPYSETTKAWAKKDAHGELWWPNASTDEVKAELQAHGEQALLSMPQAAQLALTPAASEWRTVRVEGQKVDADPEARWLTIGIVVQTRDDKGRVKARREAVVTAWKVSDSVYRAVMAHVTAPPPPVLADEASEVSESSEACEVADIAPELQPAFQALQADRLDEVLVVAMPYAAETGAENASRRADANRLCALALSHQNKFAQALPYWKILNDLEPTAHNLQQVASASAVLGDLANAQRWFDEAMALAHAEHREADRPAMPLMVANFVTALHRGGQHRAAFERLKLLAGWYASMRITDSHFVYMRGMPFFSTFVEQAAPIVRSVAGEVDIPAWYESIYSAVDDEGRAMLQDGRESWGLA